MQNNYDGLSYTLIVAIYAWVFAHDGWHCDDVEMKRNVFLPHNQQQLAKWVFYMENIWNNAARKFNDGP